MCAKTGLRNFVLVIRHVKMENAQEYCSQLHQLKAAIDEKRLELSNRYGSSSIKTTLDRTSSDNEEDNSIDETQDTAECLVPCTKRRRRSTVCGSARVSSTPTRQRICSADRAKLIDKALTKMIALTLLPISTVSNPGFIQFMNVIEPTYKVPSAPTMTVRINMAFEEIKKAVLSKLAKVDHVALSTDCWTSRAQHSYITVSVYFIDETWTPQNYVLETQEMEECHTAQHLSSKLQFIIREWNLIGKVTAIVTDNASNILAALRLMNNIIEETEDVTCSAHSLQLSIYKGLQIDDINCIINKASKIVAHFKHSTVATNALQRAQEQIQSEKKKLIQSCRTRWNSTYFMLERLIQNRIPVETVLSNRTVTSSAVAQKLEVSEYDWILMENLIKVLKLLQMAITFLCSDTMSPTSITRPIIRTVLDNHIQINEDDDNIIHQLKETVVSDLTDRFRLNWDESESPNITINQLASFLYPRSKDLLAEPVAVRSKIRSIIAEKIHHEETQHEEAENTQINCLDFLFQTNSNVNNPQTQLSHYLAEPQISHNMDPYEWWKNHEKRYPSIAKLAKTYLAIPASSAGSERVFSTAGNIVTAKRSSSDPDLFADSDRFEYSETKIQIWIRIIRIIQGFELQ
ncbi:zinc finger BED domain-containing protein 1 [Ooceraea biroi]|uniref:zinc finger BED domain-containing protein 1 n=1 Tax=Ooceraea biroi TaxID=2015173 RepID=UPI000F08143F|nr:zinc finger BED domain-containing protein 1 [Ooceraea biroi]